MELNGTLVEMPKKKPQVPCLLRREDVAAGSTGQERGWFQLSPDHFLPTYPLADATFLE